MPHSGEENDDQNSDCFTKDISRAKLQLSVDGLDTALHLIPALGLIRNGIKTASELVITTNPLEFEP